MLKILPLWSASSFGAEVQDVDLGRPLDGAPFDALRAAFGRHALWRFTDQRLKRSGMLRGAQKRSASCNPNALTWARCGSVSVCHDQYGVRSACGENTMVAPSSNFQRAIASKRVS